MIKYGWYRWISRLFGSRTFIKTNDKGEKTYVIVKGSGKYIDEITNGILSLYTEEGRGN